MLVYLTLDHPGRNFLYVLMKSNLFTRFSEVRSLEVGGLYCKKEFVAKFIQNIYIQAKSKTGKSFFQNVELDLQSIRKIFLS